VRPSKAERPQATFGPDGITYSKAIDAEINSLALGTFASGAGPRFLEYLEGITVRRVLGPEASDSHLRHLEGARWLVGVIRQRMKAGFNERKI
jgi:hypothetical protein